PQDPHGGRGPARPSAASGPSAHKSPSLGCCLCTVYPLTTVDFIDNHRLSMKHSAFMFLGGDDLMAEFSVNVSRGAGCLDEVASALAEARIESVACACAADREGIATFSVPGAVVAAQRSIPGVRAEETRAPVLTIKVANEAGCLSRVTSTFSEAGVIIASLA